MSGPSKFDSLFQKYKTFNPQAGAAQEGRFDAIFDKYRGTTAVEEEPIDITPGGPFKTDRGDFMAGFVSSLTGGIPESLGGFLKTIGLEELGSELADVSARRAAPHRVGRPTRLRDIESLGDAADYVQFALGSGLAQILPSVAGGVAGASVGGPVGAIIGALAPSYIQNTGQVQQELEQLGETDRKGLALALGVPIALLDAVTPTELANRIVSKQVAKRAVGLLGRAARGATTEGITEGTQQAIEYAGTRAATDRPIELSELMEQMAEASVQGALVGGVAGGVTRGGRPPKQAPDATTTPTPTTPEVTAEELMERNAKLLEMQKQAKQVETAKKTTASQKLKTSRKWNDLTPDERRTLYPELAETDYGKKWSELTNEAKTALLQKIIAQSTPTTPISDAPSAQGETGTPVSSTGVAPLSPADAAAREIIEAPDTDFPAAQKATEAQGIQSGIPAEPPVNPLQAQLDQLKARVAKEGVATKKVDLTAIKDSYDLRELVYNKTRNGDVADQAYETVKDGETQTFTIDEVVREAQNRLDRHKKAKEVLESQGLRVDEETGGILGGTSNFAIDYILKGKEKEAAIQALRAEQKLVSTYGKDILGRFQRKGLDETIEKAKERKSKAQATAPSSKTFNERLEEAIAADTEPEVVGGIEPARPAPSGLPISQRGTPMETVPVTPGKVVGEIKPKGKRGKKAPGEAAPTLSTGEPSAPTPEAAPVAPTPEGAVPGRPEGPSVNTESARLTVEQLEAEKNAIIDAFDSGQITPEQYVAAIKENGAKMQSAARANPEVIKVAAAEPTKFQPPDSMGKDLNQVPAERLKGWKKAYASVINNPRTSPEMRSVYQAEFDRIIKWAEIQKRNNEGGFLINPANRKIVKKRKESTLTETEKYFSRKVVLEPDQTNPINWFKAIRRAYQGVFRASHSVNVATRLYEGIEGRTLSAHEHPGKQMEMMDGSLTEAEGVLRGDGPHWPDGQGGFVRARLPGKEGTLEPVKSLAGVLEVANGDVERLGWLWAATRALDVKRLKDRNIGIDLGHAQEMYRTAPRHLHDAVFDANNFHKAQAILGHLQGLISKEAVDDFRQEIAYGPIQRVLDDRYIKAAVEMIDKTGKDAKTIIASQPFKRLKGSDLPILNMVENSIHVTYRIMRAAKLNRFKLDLVNKARQHPGLYQGIVEPAGHRLSAQVMQQATKRAEVVKALFNESEIDISNEHAQLFANLLADDAISVEGGIMQVLNNGKIELWKVDSLLAESIKSMSPVEHMWMVRAMGGPARWLRLGIVLDPAFIAMQTMIDQFQGWFNTKYGFVPVYDSFRGWWHLVRESEVAKEALRAGGVERAGLRTRIGLEEILAGPSLPPHKLARQEVATMHPLKAMNTLLTPLREATRMGEYLRARERGATPMEAAWAARDLLGNYSVEGTFATIRALNYMSAFGRPALAVIDKTARVIKDNPGRWFARGAVTLGLGALLLYLANEDDQEINDLRRTADGQRWFYFRINGRIYRTRKPYGEGAIFASTVENALDAFKGENPEAFKMMGKAILQEIVVNMLPVLGVMGYELKSGTSWRTGGSMVSAEKAKLDAEYQTGPYSGTAERLVGEATGISPAVLSYVARGLGGYLGESGLRAVSAAIDWKQTGELPPVEDWPLTQRVFARYPSYNTQPMRRFYDYAKKIEQTAETLDYTYQHRPDRILEELEQHQAELPLIETFNEARQQIADLRNSAQMLDDIRDIGPQTKKLYRDSFLRTMIEIARSSNEIADAMMRANKDIAK